jgi:hypothetical protein
MMRKRITALLVGILVSLAFATGCAGTEEASEDVPEDQITQPTDEETTEERTKARAGGSEKGGKNKTRADEVTLEVGGSEGTEFSGSCAVGDKETEVSGQVPESFVYELDGGRLDCEISAGGDLEVVLAAGENTRSVQRISGGILNLTYENGRVSSSTSSGSGGSSSSSSQVVSSQSNSSSVVVSP